MEETIEKLEEKVEKSKPELSAMVDKIVEVQTKRDNFGKRYFYHGMLLGETENFIKLEDMKDGEMLIGKSEIRTVKVMPRLKISMFLAKLNTIEDRIFSDDPMYRKMKRLKYEDKLREKYKNRDSNGRKSADSKSL